jgi:hypothetical protein
MPYGGGGVAVKRRPKDIGTAAETATVCYLRPNGFPAAERRALRGAKDAGDIAGTPGICWSVKGGEQARTASDRQITAWLAELETQRGHAGADLGVLVLQRRGVGPANAHRWWAILRGDTVLRQLGDALAAIPVRLLLADAVTLLRTAGYGTPLEVNR